MRRYARCTCLCALFGAQGFLMAATRFVAFTPEPGLSGWIETAPGVVECLPQMVHPPDSLRVGRQAGATCGVQRTLLSFDVSLLDDFQVAGAELVFYQGIPEAGTFQGTGRIRLELVDLGTSLEASDWAALSAATVLVPVPASDRQAEYRIDLTQWLAFVFEGEKRRHLQLRISLENEVQAQGSLPLEGLAAPSGLQPRLEVRFVEEVVAPLGLASPPGSQQLDPFSDTFFGLAVMNPNPLPNRIRRRLWDDAGNLVESKEGGLVVRSGQQAVVIDPSPPATHLSLRGNWGAFQGFFIGGDNSLQKQDGVGAELDSATELLFPIAGRVQGSTTRVFLFRTSTVNLAEVEAATASEAPAEVPAAGGDVLVELFARDGQPRGSATLPLGSRGSLRLDLESRFAAAASADYLRIRSQLPLRGFAMVLGPHTLRAVAGVPAEPTRKLFLPHFALSRTDDTVVQVLNPDVRPMTAQFRIHTEGRPVQTAAREIAPGRLLVVSVAELLDVDRSALPANQFLIGWASIELETAGGLPRAAGLAVFGRPGLYEAALPLPAAGRKEVLVLQVAQSKELRIFTGLSVLNPGPDAAVVRVQAFTTGGALSGERTLELAGGTRILGTLAEAVFLGQSFEQLGGYLRITADQPILVFAIFGDFELRYYSAIEAQRPTHYPDGFTERRGTCTAENRTNPGPVLIWGQPDPRAGRLAPASGNPALRLRFWDGSRVLSPLGTWASGLESAEWNVSSLQAAGITVLPDLVPAVGPYAADALLRLTIPSGTAGIFPVAVRVTDVEGCSSEFGFLLLIE
ncbi:MAG: hypothetical protein Kow001_19970 [Acidobacteriota bacterium]